MVVLICHQQLKHELICDCLCACCATLWPSTRGKEVHDGRNEQSSVSEIWTNQEKNWRKAAMTSFLCLSSSFSGTQKVKKNKTCCQQNQCWEQETLCCSSWLCPLMWGPRAQNNPKQYTQNDTASRPLTVLVLMVSSATAFNNWKAKLALFSVFIRSYVDGSHLDPVSTCLTREKKKKCVL